jgi:hypothetical protein
MLKKTTIKITLLAAATFASAASAQLQPQFGGAAQPTTPGNTTPGNTTPTFPNSGPTQNPNFPANPNFPTNPNVGGDITQAWNQNTMAAQLLVGEVQQIGQVIQMGQQVDPRKLAEVQQKLGALCNERLGLLQKAAQTGASLSLEPGSPPVRVTAELLQVESRYTQVGLEFMNMMVRFASLRPGDMQAAQEIGNRVQQLTAEASQLEQARMRIIQSAAGGGMNGGWNGGGSTGGPNTGGMNPNYPTSGGGYAPNGGGYPNDPGYAPNGGNPNGGFNGGGYNGGGYNGGGNNGGYTGEFGRN